MPQSLQPKPLKPIRNSKTRVLRTQINYTPNPPGANRGFSTVGDASLNLPQTLTRTETPFKGPLFMRLRIKLSQYLRLSPKPCP